MMMLNLERFPNLCKPLLIKEHANNAGMGAKYLLTLLSDKMSILVPLSIFSDADFKRASRASSRPLCPFLTG